MFGKIKKKELYKVNVDIRTKSNPYVLVNNTYFVVAKDIYDARGKVRKLLKVNKDIQQISICSSSLENDEIYE